MFQEGPLAGRERATAGIENDPRIRRLDVAGIVWLHHFPAKNSDVEVLRLVQVAHGEEVSYEEASCAIGASGRFMAASSGAIPSWLAPFLLAPERADFLDANAAEANRHP